MTRGRFSDLLASLVAFFLITPFVVAIGPPGLAVSALFAIVLLVGVYAVSRNRRAALAAGALALLALLLRLAFLLGAGTVAGLLANVAAAAFLAFTALLVLRRVVAPGDVDSDRIAGAVCVYLLLGLIWAYLYSMLEISRPGSFKGLTTAQGEIAFVYYSFSTLTTLGYGDVTPLTLYARTLAWLEAVVGQMFLAVTVATLVGLRLSGGGKAVPEDDGGA